MDTDANMETIRITVNDLAHVCRVHPHETLLEVLRDRLGFTGTKEGCGNGQCGACTVLLDGDPVNACILLALQAKGKKITTIEGIGGREGLHPIQAAYVEEHAVQCGFCTPGMIMSTKALLDKNRDPDDADIRTALSGNACRCTGYTNIIAAVKRAAHQICAPDGPVTDSRREAD